MGFSATRRGMVLSVVLSLLAALSCLLCGWSVQAQEHTNTASSLPMIVVSTARSADRASMAAFADRMNRVPCGKAPVYSQEPIRVEAIAGGKVKRIVVERVSQDKTPMRPEQIEDTVKRVWTGAFQTRACQIIWAEGTFWSIEASLEFEDGGAGLLLTDGQHVALRDRGGNNWFLRLLPAAQ